MYYNDYEDYMRSVLGYSNTDDNTYCHSCNYGMNYDGFENNNYRSNVSNVEHMYPEIYRIINPIVCRKCDNNRLPVTEYLIENMTDEIYDDVVNRVEVENVINLNIETREADDSTSKSSAENRGEINKASNSSNLSNKNNLNSTSSLKQSETRSPQPRRNRLLRDLIRILILNRIIRPGRPGTNRPPFGPGPGTPPIGPRPPMPGGPGFAPGVRPPMPRFDDYQW